MLISNPNSIFITFQKLSKFSLFLMIYYNILFSILSLLTKFILFFTKQTFYNKVNSYCTFIKHPLKCNYYNVSSVNWQMHKIFCEWKSNKKILFFIYFLFHLFIIIFLILKNSVRRHEANNKSVWNMKMDFSFSFILSWRSEIVLLLDFITSFLVDFLFFYLRF